MSQLPTERELLRRIELLPREVAPASDAWPNISARISTPSREQVSTGGSRRVRLFAVAATALLVAGATLIVGQLSKPSLPFPVSSELAQPELTKPEFTQLYPGAATSAASEAEYQGAFREFMAADAAHASSGQYSLGDFGAGWSALREAEVELKVALSQEPDSVFLNAHMQVLRARQVELLQQISAADMAVWSNNI
jgi:hypothetical protein